MYESFLHFVWKYQLLDHSRLLTANGEKVTIINAGTHNTNSGPDFSLAKVKIDSTLWAGNIEIHPKASDWFKHKHQYDKKYDNIILHVVYENDLSEKQSAALNFPLLELKGAIQPTLINNYKSILQHKGWIPCEKLIHSMDGFRFKSGLTSLAVERLYAKSILIEEKLRQNNNSWEETFYQLVARSYGLKINSEPFEKLSESLPMKIIGKHKNNLLQIEALLFGQAGFLHHGMNDDYGKQLLGEYLFLHEKYQIKPLKKEEWHFLRLRPASFPTVRIAQFATFLHQSVHLFSRIKEIETVKQLEKLFESGVSEYWHTHYRFNNDSKYYPKKLGTKTIHLILINSVVPVLFAYGNATANDVLKERALNLLEQIPAEANAIIKRWAELKHNARNAFDTQALLQLKNEYCDNKQCLNCHVGIFLLRKIK
jgi:hypothetical protein